MIIVLACASACWLYGAWAEAPSAALYDARIQDLERRVKSAPDDFVSEASLASLYLAKSRITGDLSEVLRAAPRAAAIEKELPDYLPGIRARASIAMNLHEFGQAVNSARRGLALEPADSALLATLYDAQFEQGSYKEALVSLAELEKAAPDEPATLVRSARSKQFAGDMKAARQLFERSVKLATMNLEEYPGPSAEYDTAWYHVAYGKALFEQGLFSEAGAQYEKARKLAPSWWLAKLCTAELMGAQRRFDEASALFREAYAASSSRPEVAHALGDLLVFAGREKEALEWFDRAESAYENAANGGYHHYLHHQAHFYSDSKIDPARAIELSRRDLEIRPSADAFDQLAWSLYRAGQLKEALEHAEKAAILSSHNPHILYHLAMIAGGLGKSKRSKELLARAAEINPRFLQFHIH